MGGGSSRNNVQTIHLDQGESVSTGYTSGRHSERDASKNSARTPRPCDPEGSQSKDEEIASLTAQLCESESQRLDLEDRIQVLEERLEYANAQNLLAEEKPCEETLHAKDQYISKVEKEKQELQTEMNKLKQRHRKKIKLLTSQLTEHKQETNFQTMELRDEISRLQEDNKALAEKSGMSPAKPSPLVNVAPELPGGDKMMLILELSQQVTEQGDKINHLERKVKERDQTIEELRVRLRNNAEYLKAVDGADTKARSNSIRTDSERRQRHNGSDRQQQYTNSLSSGNVANKPAKSSLNKTNNGVAESSSKNDIDSLFAVTEEEDEDFNDTDSMQKLSFLLHGTKSSNDKPVRDRIIRDATVNPPPIGPLEETNESSNGRDSGLGSAGKREKAEATDSQKDLPDWKDFESGLSDSDVDHNQYLHSKIASAPPKLQNGSGQKQNGSGQKVKKKSSSLRQRASQRSQDKPPRPGLAFVNNSDMSDGSTASLFSLSKDISRVEVS